MRTIRVVIAAAVTELAGEIIGSWLAAQLTSKKK